MSDETKPPKWDYRIARSKPPTKAQTTTATATWNLRAKFCPVCGDPQPKRLTYKAAAVRIQYRCNDCGTFFTVEEQLTRCRSVQDAAMAPEKSSQTKENT